MSMLTGEARMFASRGAGGVAACARCSAAACLRERTPRSPISADARAYAQAAR